MIHRDLVIIGGGPAGMAAAVAAFDAGVKDILLIERDMFLGGILNQCIHTGFGMEYFNELLTGPEYADKFIKRILKIPDIEVSLGSFVVKLTKDKIITYLKPGGFEQVKANAIIIATGCRERTREMIHIPGSRPAGVLTAGLAQKLINIEGYIPGKKVVIVGSGDIGLIMARRFVLEGSEVKAVIEIEKESKGLVRNIVQCIEDFNIPIYYNHKISRIHGNMRVEKVNVIEVDKNYDIISGSEFSIDCDTVLLSVGLIPENELIEMAGVEIDGRTNCPVSDEFGKTSISGIFACGNSFKVYDIVDSVSHDSEETGRCAADYLFKEM